MEDLIEYLQIKLAESFGEDDDNVIEKLRENMHELISNKMIYPCKLGMKLYAEDPNSVFSVMNFSTHQATVVF